MISGIGADKNDPVSMTVDAPSDGALSLDVTANSLVGPDATGVNCDPVGTDTIPTSKINSYESPKIVTVVPAND